MIPTHLYYPRPFNIDTFRAYRGTMMLKYVGISNLPILGDKG